MTHRTVIIVSTSLPLIILTIIIVHSTSSTKSSLSPLSPSSSSSTTTTATPPPLNVMSMLKIQAQPQPPLPPLPSNILSMLKAPPQPQPPLPSLPSNILSMLKAPPPPPPSLPSNTLSMLRTHPTHRFPSSILPDCDPRSCQPPDCACPSYEHPGDFPVSRVPMMIMVTFDDAVTSSKYEYFQRIMDQQFRNPNGCPMKMTFFVSDDGGTNYKLIRKLYRKGHEIASHSVSHRYPESWWARASVGEYRQEFGGMRNRLTRRAGVPRARVSGMRVPYLAINGDSLMEAARASHFTYDSSCVSLHRPDSQHNVLWPYTLDFVPPREVCDQPERPTRSYPGIWEVPLTQYSCENGHSGYMLDECRGNIGNGTMTDIVNFFWRQFARHFKTRAPMGIFTHATFFDDEKHALRGLIEFLRGVAMLDDVWLVSVGQVVDWMKEPTPTSDLNDFEAWKC